VSAPISPLTSVNPLSSCAVEGCRHLTGAISARQLSLHPAAELGVSTATVSRVLRRLGLNRLKALKPAEPVRRYERENPGELIHIDIKKLGRFDRPGHRVTGDRTGQSNSRGIGWEYLHVCIDDHSRVAFSQIMPDEKKESAVAFLNAALAYYNSLSVSVSRVMTDIGACYKAHAFRDACRNRGLKHIRTRPYPPQTTGYLQRRSHRSMCGRSGAFGASCSTAITRSKGKESSGGRCRMSVPSNIISPSCRRACRDHGSKAARQAQETPPPRVTSVAPAHVGLGGGSLCRPAREHLPAARRRGPAAADPFRPAQVLRPARHRCGGRRAIGRGCCSQDRSDGRTGRIRNIEGLRDTMSETQV